MLGKLDSDIRAKFSGEALEVKIAIIFPIEKLTVTQGINIYNIYLQFYKKE